MAISATESTVIEATYDRWTVTLSQAGDGCVGLGEAAPLDSQGEPADPPIRLMIGAVKYRVREDGRSERSPLPGDRRQLEIPDLYAACYADPQLASAMAGVTAAIVAHLAAQGAL
jgi:hypothetical protein